MSYKEVTAYKVVCDDPGCKFETRDLGGEYSFWDDKSIADDEWVNSDAQSVPGDLHYCPKHIRPSCGDCDKVTDLVNDADDESGDWWCREHLETAPDYEAPGVVA